MLLLGLPGWPFEKSLGRVMYSGVLRNGIPGEHSLSTYIVHHVNGDCLNRTREQSV